MTTKDIQHPYPKLSQHPLMGVNLGNLIDLLTQQNKKAITKWPFALAFAASAFARFPFAMVDRWKARRQHAVEKLESPLFIVGYWRSGTTHLHNLLAQSSDAGIITPLGSGLPDELLTLGTWLRPLLEMGIPEDRGVDDVAVTPRSPQEDEIPVANLQSLSVFHALYFPADFKKNFNRGVFFDGVSRKEIACWKSQMLYFLGKVALHQGKQPLLIKNPVYTARIDLLRSIWPNARFIHIYRNPYHVYQSTMRYYPKMINDLGLQHYNWAEIKPVIIDSYPRMMNKFYNDSENIPDNQLIEINFEDVEQKPLSILEKVYRQLDLPGWNTAKIRTQAYLKTIDDYSKNKYDYGRAVFEEVEKYWGKFVERWGYQRPRITRLPVKRRNEQ